RPALAPGPVYALVDGDALEFPERGPAAVVEAVDALARAGIGWIQLRLKHGHDRERHAAVEGAVRAVEGTSAVLWIDDRADLAALFRAPGRRLGLHVGQQDLLPGDARRVVGEGCWIGLSCHDPEQVRAADADPAVDVVACGPVYPTRSKARPDPVIGLEGVRQARRLTTKPLVAIGGIDAGRLAAVLDAGADTAAVLGALCAGQPPPRELARRARELLKAAGGRIA
ncbi:MAG: thiamine phosphate synthase, partial [Holophagales bacterium]|nr:thiamine phosphate synthase [Holophagales bacterium]